MLRVLRKSIDVEVEVEHIRQSIQKNISTSLRAVYDQLDWLNRGFITKAEIKRVIDQNMHILANNQHLVALSNIESVEMEALVRRFNKDKQSGKISMLEFIDELNHKMLN